MPRTIAIGDIHGCLSAFAQLLDMIQPEPADTIVTLGDYVDRGTDSPGVITQLMELAGRTQLVPLLGNHDLMMVSAPRAPDMLPFWLQCGGDKTLDSYGVRLPSDLPADHLAFLEGCRPYLELTDWFFVHANYLPELPLQEQNDETRYWLSLRDFLPGPHLSGRRAIVGHTPQREVLNLGHLLGIDTGCVYGGWLSAVDVHTGCLWQTNLTGETRTDRLDLRFDPVAAAQTKIEAAPATGENSPPILPPPPTESIWSRWWRRRSP